MQERKLTIEDLATQLHLGPRQMRGLLTGDISIDVDRAAVLSKVLGGSSRFWLTREAEYCEDSIRILAADWSASLPLQHMQDLGWMEPATHWREQIEECLRFFGVDDYEEWIQKYSHQTRRAHYRKTAAFPNDENATLVWFRAAEREFEKLLFAKEYSRDAIETRLGALRKLTRIRDPQVFVPKLQAECSGAGVAVVVVPTPRGCRASGATRWINARPLIQLSARHQSDDHFWFTLFHELGHVLCHGATSGDFIDLDGAERGVDVLEDEADTFATRVILGETTTIESVPHGDYRDVIREAARLGVGPGLLAGQLQYHGLAAQDRLNGLKRRYRWIGTTLVSK